MPPEAAALLLRRLSGRLLTGVSLSVFTKWIIWIMLLCKPSFIYLNVTLCEGGLLLKQHICFSAPNEVLNILKT